MGWFRSQNESRDRSIPKQHKPQKRRKYTLASRSLHTSLHRFSQGIKPENEYQFDEGLKMKSVTEFWSFNLAKGLTAKEALAAEGKSPEEIQTSIGEKFKMEGDKLKHFVNALEVVSQNPEGLSRVLVVGLAEGEKVPLKSVQVEEFYYVPEFTIAPKAVVGKIDRKNQDKGKKGKGGPKESPWGLSPEQKAAKKGPRKAEAPATPEKK